MEQMSRAAVRAHVMRCSAKALPKALKKLSLPNRLPLRG
jgi:hypothetical protein